MRRWAGILLAVVLGSAAFSPNIALAHDCSSLNDCWRVAQESVASIVGTVIAAMLAIFLQIARGASPPPPIAIEAAAPATPPVTVGTEGSGSQIEVKAGADIDGVSDAIRDTFDDIADVWSSNDAPTPVITSGNDSTHRGSSSPGTDCSSVALCRQTSDSRHYQDDAIDVRGNNMTDEMQDRVANDLQERLGDDYDVESEHFPNSPAVDHIHIEYDPN